MVRRTAAALSLLCVLSVAARLHAAGPQIWRLEGARAFLDGDLTALSVDALGRLRLGPAPRLVYDPAVPNAWSVARDAKGALYPRHRQRREDRQGRWHVGLGALRLGTSSRRTPSPSGPTAACTRAPRRMAPCTRSTVRARRRGSSIPRRSTSGPSRSTARATCTLRRAARGRSTRSGATARAPPFSRRRTRTSSRLLSTRAADSTPALPRAAVSTGSTSRAVPSCSSTRPSANCAPSSRRRTAPSCT